MRRLTLSFMLFLAFLLAAPAPRVLAQATNYDALIAQSAELLKNNKPDEAFQKALAAINANAARHEGYFYAGVASYRQDSLESAEKYI
jgi:hypothetical protein